ncbi:unnamed protein product, partial [Iphiclides podalirius]
MYRPGLVDANFRDHGSAVDFMGLNGVVLVHSRRETKDTRREWELRTRLHLGAFTFRWMKPRRWEPQHPPQRPPPFPVFDTFSLASLIQTDCPDSEV